MHAVGTAEMARRLSASPEKLRAMAKSGEVPYIAVGRKMTYVPERVFEALERKANVTAITGRSERSRRSRRRAA